MSEQIQTRTLLILAAGMGSRYGGLKQIDPMGPSGETILDYSIHDAAKAGFRKLVFVIRRSFEDAFRAAIGKRYENGMDVHYVFQELNSLPEGFRCPEGREKPWGTGHAILMGEPAIREPFAVINADDFYGGDAFHVLSKFLMARATSSSLVEEYALVGYILRNTLSDHGSVSRGICTVSDDGYLSGICERTSIRREGNAAVCEEPGVSPIRLSGDELVSLNLWGFTPAIFSDLHLLFTEFLRRHGDEMKSEFFIPFAVDELISRGKAKVRVLQTSSSWMGITYREDKPLVQAALKKMAQTGEYPPALF